MIAVDTNVLVRLLINDPGSQAQVSLAKALLKLVKQVYVPQIIQIAQPLRIDAFQGRTS